jgi:hypothetical protein
VPGCYPYGVRAIWSEREERSRHMRGGAVLGSSGKVAGLAVRFLSPDRMHTAAPNNRSSTLGQGIPGYQWQIVQTRLKVDAQLDQLTLMCATPTIRLSLTASAPCN